MSSMQSKVLSKITKIIEAAKWEVIDVPNWSNTGHLSIQQQDEIGELGSVKYNFQPGTMTLSIKIGKKNIPSQPGREGYFDFYMDYTDVECYRAFEATLRQSIKGIKVPA